MSGNLSSPGYKHLTPIFSTPGLKPTCHGGTDTLVSVVTTSRSVLCYVLPMSRPTRRSQNKALGVIESLLLRVLKFLYIREREKNCQ